MFFANAYAGTSITLPQASKVAVRVDQLHDFLWWLSLFFLAGVTFAVVMFAIKYHRSKKGRETAYILGSHVLEALWTFIPLILMLGIFAWGYIDYRAMREDLVNPLEINVVGRQWLWNFEYANGRKTMNELVIPKGRPVKLIMTSEDVLHGFFLPYMRIKQDVVPGMYTSLSFEATLAGEQPVFCTEFCGTGHSDMLARAYVLEPADFDRWLESGKLSGVAKNPNPLGERAPVATASSSGAGLQPLAEKGRELARAKGCFACHSVDGNRMVGPSWKGLFGSDREFEAGAGVKADENYIRESIVEPNSKVVKGFPPSMPPFKGLLSDEEINSIIAYIKSLK